MEKVFLPDFWSNNFQHVSPLICFDIKTWGNFARPPKLTMQSDYTRAEEFKEVFSPTNINIPARTKKAKTFHFVASNDSQLVLLPLHRYGQLSANIFPSPTQLGESCKGKTTENLLKED
jgi:hypothetical protein